MVWDLSPIIFELGPLSLRYYGIIFAAMLIGGFYIWRGQMLRAGYSEDTADRYLLWGTIAVIVGSRVAHVTVYEWEFFIKEPTMIFYVWKGGLASHGATAGLMISLWLFARVEKMKMIEAWDRVAMPAALAAMSVRIGNFLNSEIVGRITDVPWGIKFPLSYADSGLTIDKVPFRHPSQLYEFFLGGLILLMLYLVDRKLKEERPLGLLCSLFFTCYFSARFFVEYFKNYQTLSAETSILTMGQWLSIPFIIGGVIGLFFTFKYNIPTSTFAPEPVKEVESNSGPHPGKKKKRKKGSGKKKKRS